MRLPQQNTILMEDQFRDPERLDLPSASSFNITTMCPGSRNLIMSLPRVEEEPPDETAERGTRLHKAWETDDPSELDDEDSDIYKAGLDYKAKAVAQWCADNGITDYREGPKETRLWLHDSETMKPLSSGMMDWHFIAARHLLVGDFKSLYCPTLTPSHRNLQIRKLVVLAFMEYDDVEMVRGVLVKPIAKWQRIDAVDYCQKDIEFSRQQIMQSLWESYQPDAQRRPGAHCNYCPAKAFCAECSSYALLPSAMVGNALDMVERLTPADLVTIWERSTVIGKILDAVKTRLKGFSDEQLALLGIGRTPGRRLDPIIKTKEAVDFFLSEGINREELWSALKLSKTELQKAIMRDQGWPADKTRGYLKQMLVPFIEEKQAAAGLEKV